MERTIVIGNLNSKEVRDYAIYCDNRIAFVKDLKNINVQYPVRVDAFIAILCLQGRSTLYIDNKIHEIKANDMLICHPNIVLDKSMNSLDAEFRSICISKEYIRQLSLTSNSYSWDIAKFLEQSPVLSLTDEEVLTFCRYYDLIQAKVTSNAKQQTYREELMDNLLKAFLYEFGELLNRFIKIKPGMFTASEKMFRNFLDLMNGLSPKPRSVSFYADKLCITPKYLSNICREASGHNASDLINHFVVKDIEYQLRIPGKSIKEVCNDLDFPNISFFGRYVKKYLGMSPKQWREKNT